MLARFQPACLAAAVLLLAGLAVAQPSQTNSVNELLREGRDNCRQSSGARRRPPSARRFSAIRRIRGPIPPWGGVCMSRGDFRKRWRRWARSWRWRRPTDCPFLSRLLPLPLAGFSAGRRFLRAFPGRQSANTNAQYWLSRSLSSLGRYREAIAAFGKLLELRPPMPRFICRWVTVTTNSRITKPPPLCSNARLPPTRRMPERIIG